MRALRRMAFAGTAASCRFCRRLINLEKAAWFLNRSKIIAACHLQTVGNKSPIGRLRKYCFVSIASMKKNRPWTDEDDRRLLELKDAGRTPISIAMSLRRTRAACNARMHKLRNGEAKAAQPSGLNTMASFNPSEPAILHDRSADKIETWTGEHAADYRQNAVMNADGTVEWREFVFDGWGNVLGG